MFVQLFFIFYPGGVFVLRVVWLLSSFIHHVLSVYHSPCCVACHHMLLILVTINHGHNLCLVARSGVDYWIMHYLWSPDIHLNGMSGEWRVCKVDWSSFQKVSSLPMAVFLFCHHMFRSSSVHVFIILSSHFQTPHKSS